MDKLSHYTEDGSSRMVDVSGKKITQRTAKASGFVRMQPATLDLIEKKLMPKGNVFEVAKIAGIIGAKKTSELIPMCHPLMISHVDLKISLDKERTGVIIESEVKLEGKTGVEMEALSAISIAALTIYDMCKAVDKNMIIEDIKLIEKKGGKSDFNLR
ncbi:MAG: cyclic pyranopterin monophosphate synthase MoaC [Spirochaetes bacterium]|nr:cyclic pyranopterin monophosphate synthase MoaC [Spirochaetota bacterium]